MASIRSVLIKTCMANIQKEVSQLEHWLLNLPNDVEEPSCSQATSSNKDSNVASDSIDLRRLYDGIERMNQQLNFQQITLAHITDRIEILENFRDIPIQHKEEVSPWLTDAVNLDEEEDDAPVIHVIHMDETNQKVEATSTDSKNEETAPVMETVTPVQPQIEDEKVNRAVVEEIPNEKEILAQKVEERPKEEPVEEEQPEEEPVEEEEKEEHVEEQEQPEEEPVEEEEQVEEEMEGTVFEYKDITYYRDLDNHVFAVDENGELSDMAIGFWKEKTQTILFYKMK